MLSGQRADHESGSGPAGLRFEGYMLDLTGRVLLDAAGRDMGLTRGEFAVLEVFARHPGRVLSRARLRKAIDGRRPGPHDRSIDMLVGRLRRKIEAGAAKPRYIITVPGSGYKFVPPVRVAEPFPEALGAPLKPDRRTDAVATERRQLTVLSCQILGFTAAAAKADPEDLERAIRPVYAACAQAFARYGGTVALAVGDSVLGYFGHPKARENDAENAVRAALDLIRAIASIQALPVGKFRPRVGIATGLMVIGELNSPGIKEPTAIGPALGLALRMQKVAPADGVVVAATTLDLIGRLFVCRPARPVAMDGEQDPVPAWHVVEETIDLPRFEALRRVGMPNMVGRDTEIERLLKCWLRAESGSGQVVLLTGEAGIGKSRLLFELQKRLDREPHTSIRWSGSPRRMDTPMAVLVDQMLSSAGFAKAESAQQKLDKIRTMFAALPAIREEATGLLAELLDLPSEAAAKVEQLAPQKRKERTFAALLAWIEYLAAQRPVFALVEDIHWVDPSSLNFLALLVQRASKLRIFLVLVGRPEFVPPWPSHSHVTRLVLSRLGHSDSALLVAHMTGEHRLPAGVEADIIARADGVPLFIEELTKSILESSDNSGPTRRSCPGAPPIPTTLQGLLLARLDRLDRGKEVAQAAAVIGRKFSLALLRGIARMDEATLVAGLDELLSSELIFLGGPAPASTFVFKHALVRDAAYGMLPFARRQLLHAGVAQSYEDQFAATGEAEPELLAYHFREAGHPIKSIGYLLAAAERALLRSATTEALAHLAPARELIEALPERCERLQFALKLEITLARALLATRGYTAPETRDAYRRARACCEELGDEDSLPLVMHGQWLGAWIAADHRSAIEQARQLYRWGERNKDPVGLAVGSSDMGMTLITLGRLLEARRYLDQALQINKFVLPGREPFVASDIDGRISTLSFLHNCLLLLGLTDQAAAIVQEVAALRPDNLYSRALAQLRMLRMRVFAREAESVVADGLDLLRLAEQQGYPHMAAVASLFTGWALAQRGDPVGGTVYCENGLTQLQRTGSACWLPFHLALLADSYEQAGDQTRCAATLAQALQSVETTGERLWEAEIFRKKGHFLLAGGDADGAEICFLTALQKSRAQSAKLLELRAAVSLADLRNRLGKTAEARAALGPVYASFTEGFDCIDLREAKSLLDVPPIDMPPIDEIERAPI